MIKGKTIKFNSMIDAMNYMGLEGWVFVNAYTLEKDGNISYHWLLKKIVKKEDLEALD